jgi:hypothetical protein
MSFRWQWMGSEDHADQSGTATFWLSARMVEFTLPNSAVAHVLAAAIERELKEAKREGAAIVAEAVRSVLPTPPKTP